MPFLPVGVFVFVWSLPLILPRILPPIIGLLDPLLLSSYAAPRNLSNHHGFSGDHLISLAIALVDNQFLSIYVIYDISTQVFCIFQLIGRQHNQRSLYLLCKINNKNSINWGLREACRLCCYRYPQQQQIQKHLLIGDPNNKNINRLGFPITITKTSIDCGSQDAHNWTLTERLPPSPPSATATTTIKEEIKPWSLFPTTTEPMKWEHYLFCWSWSIFIVYSNDWRKDWFFGHKNSRKNDRRNSGGTLCQNVNLIDI